jgi:hypothetical protein
MRIVVGYNLSYHLPFIWIHSTANLNCGDPDGRLNTFFLASANYRLKANAHPPVDRFLDRFKRESQQQDGQYKLWTWEKHFSFGSEFC